MFPELVPPSRGFNREFFQETEIPPFLVTLKLGKTGWLRDELAA
jgi:hypothetical protein